MNKIIKQRADYRKTIDFLLHRNIVYIISFLLLVFFLVIDTSLYNIKIEYSDVKLDSYNNPTVGISMKTRKGERLLSDESIQNNKFNYGLIKSSQWTRRNNEIELVIKSKSDGAQWLGIKGIWFRFLTIELFKIDGNNYEDFLQSNQYIQSDQGNNLKIELVENEALLCFNSNQLIDKGELKKKIIECKAGIIILLSVIFFAICIIDIKTKDRNSAEHKKWALLISVVFVLISIMSFLGMPNANPDEKVSSEAVKYYYSHLGLPDYTSDDVLSTFSNYGHSRLNSFTPYYFIAGKIGKLANILNGSEVSYRLFNLILFLFIVVLFIIKGNKNKWLLPGIVLTPQLWYLFSYTTSDAWDYCLCFIISLCLVLDKQVKRRIMFSVFRGVLFAFLFMGKQNYFVMALFAFLVYLIELVFDDKNKKKRIKEYSIVLGTTILLYFIRVILEYIQYGSTKSELLTAISSSYAHITVIPMINRGADILYLVTETTLFKSLFQSFTGYFGSMTFPSGKIYYFLIQLLYIALLSYLGYYCYKKRNKKLLIQAISTYSMIFVALFLVLYHCWTSDFQSQGRYLFGIIPCLMFLVSREKSFYEGKPYEYLMEGITILSLVSFVKYGMINII